MVSVLSVFIRRAWVEHVSRSEAREPADFYLRGREVSIIATCDAEYKKLVEYCVKFDKVLFGFRERDVVDYIIYRSKQGVSESQLKQVLAVVGLICDVCGFESPSFESSASRGGLRKSTTVSSQCHCLSLRGYEEEDMKTRV
jgi:hypothetical protein